VEREIRRELRRRLHLALEVDGEPATAVEVLDRDRECRRVAEPVGAGRARCEILVPTIIGVIANRL